MIEKRQFYINGQWVDPASPKDLDVIDPATEEVCAVISIGDQADTDADGVGDGGDNGEGNSPVNVIRCC